MVEPAIGIRDEFLKKYKSYAKAVLCNSFLDKYPECNLSVSDFSTAHLQKKSILSWELPITIFEPAKGEEVEYARESICFTMLIIPFFKSAWYVLVHTPRVTDYAFPFLLALA